MKEGEAEEAEGLDAKERRESALKHSSSSSSSERSRAVRKGGGA